MKTRGSGEGREGATHKLCNLTFPMRTPEYGCSQEEAAIDRLPHKQASGHVRRGPLAHNSPSSSNMLLVGASSVHPQLFIWSVRHELSLSRARIRARHEVRAAVLDRSGATKQTPHARAESSRTRVRPTRLPTKPKSTCHKPVLLVRGGWSVQWHSQADARECRTTRGAFLSQWNLRAGGRRHKLCSLAVHRTGLLPSRGPVSAVKSALNRFDSVRARWGLLRA